VNGARNADVRLQSQHEVLDVFVMELQQQALAARRRINGPSNHRLKRQVRPKASTLPPLEREPAFIGCNDRLDAVVTSHRIELRADVPADLRVDDGGLPSKKAV
jgi:hypothetical protein